MTLSVIIVNYNVKYFLEQCLCSVGKAIEKIEAEVFVVDNDSNDGSAEYLGPKFSEAIFICNKENEGFGKANNRALSLATGKYILFLNPDTIVAEDSFEKCISFLESNQRTGALGVKMIDGSGVYLKESKRGFPSLWTGFCKLGGLTSLFPHSKVFARYYLGNLNEKENQVIDVVSGAYFFVRKETLDKTGGFDEQFFMYAEDIDLSCRIQQAGFLNYYFAQTTIIHFKGESTRKDIRYVKLFYKAMSQFAKKYFSSGASALFSLMIECAIWVRAGLALIGNLFLLRKAYKKEGKKYYLTGDADTIIQLKKILPEKKIVCDNENDADEIIFCEGKTFPFSEIIRAVEKKSTKAEYKMHASNSFGIVGSYSKENTGEMIALSQS